MRQVHVGADKLVAVYAGKTVPIDDLPARAQSRWPWRAQSAGLMTAAALRVQLNGHIPAVRGRPLMAESSRSGPAPIA